MKPAVGQATRSAVEETRGDGVLILRGLSSSSCSCVLSGGVRTWRRRSKVKLADVVVFSLLSRFQGQASRGETHPETSGWSGEGHVCVYVSVCLSHSCVRCMRRCVFLISSPSAGVLFVLKQGSVNFPFVATLRFERRCQRRNANCKLSCRHTLSTKSLSAATTVYRAILLNRCACACSARCAKKIRVSQADGVATGTHCKVGVVSTAVPLPCPYHSEQPQPLLSARGRKALQSSSGS